MNHLSGQKAFFNTRQFANVDTNLLRLFLIAFLVFFVMSLLNPGKFLTGRNFTSMAFQFPELGLFAFAIMISLISGGIDLSIISSANLAGILAALVLTRVIPENAGGIQLFFWLLLAISAALATGAACGLINGFLIARVRITPILATLGSMQLYMGIAYIITEGPAVYGYPELFLAIGNSRLWQFPVPFLIFVAVAVILSLVLNKTRFGINLFMLGTNEIAARFSGIRIRAMLLKTYFLSGILSGVTGLIMIARTNSAKADYGSSYLLQAVLVAILGGVHPNGGFGTVFGVVIAVLALQFLSSGFNMLRFNNFAREFTWGGLLLAVMVLHFLSNRRKSNV
ncbi:ABC transporter permease [candidate division KSB1 bacterium]|nr:ABC transporter permease [candidate division KSB1 bacterium]